MPRLEFHRRLLRWLFGLILLTAAILKLQDWIEWPRETALTASSLVVPAGAGAEILLALWLFFGLLRRHSLLVATGAFGCFAIVSLWKIAHGIEICGCFGKWHTSPKATYWLDAAAFCLGLWALRSPWARPASEEKGILRAGWIFRFLLPGILVLSLGFYEVALVRGRNMAFPSGSWLGASWPPVGAVDVAADLSRGRWIVLIYDSSCGHCRSRAADYAEMDQDFQAHGVRTRVALIDADAGQGWEPIDWNTAPYSEWIARYDLPDETGGHAEQTRKIET